MEEEEEKLAEQIKEDLKRPDYPKFIKYLFDRTSDEFKLFFLTTWLADGPDIFNASYYTALKLCQSSNLRVLISLLSNIYVPC